MVNRNVLSTVLQPTSTTVDIWYLQSAFSQSHSGCTHCLSHNARQQTRHDCSLQGYQLSKLTQSSSSSRCISCGEPWWQVKLINYAQQFTWLQSLLGLLMFVSSEHHCVNFHLHQLSRYPDIRSTWWDTKLTVPFLFTFLCIRLRISQLGFYRWAWNFAWRFGHISEHVWCEDGAPNVKQFSRASNFCDLSRITKLNARKILELPIAISLSAKNIN